MKNLLDEQSLIALNNLQKSLEIRNKAISNIAREVQNMPKEHIDLFNKTIKEGLEKLKDNS